jgi:hypothetical protein
MVLIFRAGTGDLFSFPILPSATDFDAGGAQNGAQSSNHAIHLTRRLQGTQKMLSSWPSKKPGSSTLTGCTRNEELKTSLRILLGAL